MGVLSLHNECPPLGFGEEAKATCDGLVLGEEATSALLKTVSDCVTFLAGIDDTVGAVISQWRAVLDMASRAGGEMMAMPSNGAADRYQGQAPSPMLAQYSQAFEALTPVADRIDTALEKYRKLKTYAHQALEAGRGKEFQSKLQSVAGSDFPGLVNLRIELLRKVKVRVLLLENLKPLGAQQLKENDMPGFFLVLMQPIRDLAVEVNNLYSETVRSALASHTTLMQSCRMLGEGMTDMGSSAVQELQMAGVR